MRHRGFSTALIATGMLIGAAVGTPKVQAQTSSPSAKAGSMQFKLFLEPASCGRFDWGTIACGVEYLATLSSDRKRWYVVGANKAGEQGIGAEYPTTSPEIISLWGVNFTRKGTDLLFGNALVGKATLVR